MVQREAGSETTTRGGVRCGVVARAQATGCTVYIYTLHRLYW